MSSETPRQVVSSFDHLVTQWMSTVTSSWGRAWNSSQVHEDAFRTAPCTLKLQLVCRVRGVGPAESTGKPFVTYCPGGTRAASAGARRPRKLREMTTGDLLAYPKVKA